MFSAIKEYKHFTLGLSSAGETLLSDRDERLNYYLLASAVDHLTRKVLSLGGQEITMYDMGDITEVSVQVESDINTFFESLDFELINKETIQYLKVIYSKAKRMPGFPPTWR